MKITDDHWEQSLDQHDSKSIQILNQKHIFHNQVNYETATWK